MFEPIKGYGGLYSINREGIIFSEEKGKGATYDNLVPRKELKQKLTNTGRLSVKLLSKGRPKYYFVHRLVAIQFIPNPENKPQINHKDGKPLNNNVDNLEWCTGRENVDHAMANGLLKGIKGKDRWQSKPIIQNDISGNKINEWESISMACKALGFSKGNVIKCAKGVYETAYGFKWAYA